MSQIWIGTSGWSYKHWDGGIFYPPKLAAGEHLAFYAQQFATVEINYSYYQLPPKSTFEAWRRKSPENFLFAVKASRYLTHMKKLKEPTEPLQRLLDHASGLGEKLGPMLFQFPRQWKRDLERLRGFLVELQTRPAHRYAFEFRHHSWLSAEVYDLLRDSDVALCLPIGWGIPLDVQLTARWTYLRFHGGANSIAFTAAELEPWAQRLSAWRADGIDSFSYFNNDTLEDGRAPAIDNARRLREMIDG